MSSIDHSTDEISQAEIERLEMRRLGLPLSFGPKNKKKTYLKADSGLSSGTVAAATPLAANKRELKESGKKVHKKKKNLQTPLSDSPPNDFEVIDYDDDELQLMAGVESLEEGSDSPDELSSFKMTDDSYDFIEIEKLKISNDTDTDDDEDDKLQDKKKQSGIRKKASAKKGKSVDTDDDMTTETVSDVSRKDLCPSTKQKKKKSQREKKNTYFRQRFLLFSRFSQGIRLDKESWYSVTPEPIARHIAERIERALITRHQKQLLQEDANSGELQQEQLVNKFIILDGFCGAGGNTIQFALLPTTSLVYAIDIDPKKIELARHNATIYGCVDKIRFIVDDFFEVVKSDLLPRKQVDACFLSPPWGGPNYNFLPSYSLTQMTPDGFEIARQAAVNITKNISFLLPRNFDMTELEKLSSIVYANNAEGLPIKAEIEENLLFKKVKTLTAYFGELVFPKEDEGGDGDEGEITVLTTSNAEAFFPSDKEGHSSWRHQSSV